MVSREDRQQECRQHRTLVRRVVALVDGCGLHFACPGRVQTNIQITKMADSPAHQHKSVPEAIIESYLVFALRLKDPHCTRTQLAGIAREINKLLPMAAMLLLRHGDSLKRAFVNRRLGKRD